MIILFKRRPLPLNFQKKAVNSYDVLPFSLSQNYLVHQCIMGKKSAKSSLPPVVTVVTASHACILKLYKYIGDQMGYPVKENQACPPLR